MALTLPYFTEFGKPAFQLDGSWDGSFYGWVTYGSWVGID